MSRIRSAASAETRTGIALFLTAVGAGGVVAAAPSLAAQLGLIAASALALVSAVFARANRILDPIWIATATIYLIDPLDLVRVSLGIGVPIVAVLAVAPAPFAATALWLRPRIHDRMVLLVPLGAIVGIAALSLAWSPVPSVGISKLGVWILTGAIPAVYVFILTAASGRVSWWVLGIVAVAGACGLLLFGEPTTLYPGRPVLFEMNPIWVARGLFLGALVVGFGPFPPVVKVVVAPVLVVAGIQTDSLGPLVGLAAGAWAGVTERLRLSPWANRWIMFAWLALGGAVALILLLGGSLGRDPVLVSAAADPNVTSRANFLGSSLALFGSAPLFGVGLGGFASTGLAEFPHSVLAEVAAELGIVGVSALIVWFLMAVRGAAGSPIVVAVLVASAVFSLFSGSLASNSEFWIFSGMAMATYPWRGRRRADPDVAP